MLRAPYLQFIRKHKKKFEKWQRRFPSTLSKEYELKKKNNKNSEKYVISD